MHLTKIKLAGFKSFVDPTTIYLPTQLVAVVGPNGCGKSNIIDAVCWVMGESSAKFLRGESLVDVIFNGSSARKPIGQASVELVFDNQDGSIGGEYAGYAEISIRRQIGRDAESTYFLNGSRCRRRDIIDIFLGTGLGPRSYSIIGQNMIQRILEAKPEEMRVYLEEAAGVSKYKERRRETENRIVHTKDNLSRLNDVRFELDKQLTLLKRQASAAEKFKSLKEEERHLKAQCLAVQWRQLDARLVSDTLQIQQQSTGLEACQANLSDLNLQLEYKRDSHRLAGDQFQDVQKHYYSIGSEVTRLEQEIQHNQSRKQQLQADFRLVEQEWLETKDLLEESEHELNDLQQEAELLGPQRETAHAAVVAATNQLKQAETDVHNFQLQWDDFNQTMAQNTQQAQVEQTRIQHIEQKMTALSQRQARLEQDAAQIDIAQVENDIAAYSTQVLQVTTDLNDKEAQAAQCKEKISHLQKSQQTTTEELNKVRHELQVLSGKQASLQALQETALGQTDNTLRQWLKKHKLDGQPRLGQSVEVTEGWERAVETVLGPYVQAICVDELSGAAPWFDELQDGNVCIVSKNSPSATALEAKNSLLSKVTSPWSLTPFLENVYVTDSLPEALVTAVDLAPHESVITPAGEWIGPSWACISKETNPEAGIFQREQELKQLAKQMSERSHAQETLTTKLSKLRSDITQHDQEYHQLQKIANDFRAKSVEARTQQKMQQQRLTEFKQRIGQFQQDQAHCATQLQQAQEELAQARASWQQAMTDLEEQTGLRAELVKQRGSLQALLTTARQELQLAQGPAQQLEIRLQTTQSQQASLQNALGRLENKLAQLEERKTRLHDEINELPAIDGLQEDLENALKGRIILQNELTSARQAMETITQELQHFESRRHEIEREIARFRDMLEALRVQSQGIKVKAETLIEQLTETGFQLSDILQDLPEVTTLDEWASRLDQIVQRIGRLGAINLIAIEEHKACAERKDYLDKQNNDLEEALKTLENAIATIDKETRARFKQTFDKVNVQFQALFPKIFGGGQAYLELTGENLLDAGISVMACPPGKRNSTIHLLSGGEKALTAIALVFSIFHLNPAPFCLLDEVDAPLDDANILRFCQLVKSMSEKTQFLFISHNKLAIEIADSLIGVTMNEPGVSRLVSVDVQQALLLAGE